MPLGPGGLAIGYKILKSGSSRRVDRLYAFLINSSHFRFQI
jgi:hypothetical protein